MTFAARHLGGNLNTRSPKSSYSSSEERSGFFAPQAELEEDSSVRSSKHLLGGHEHNELLRQRNDVTEGKRNKDVT